LRSIRPGNLSAGPYPAGVKRIRVLVEGHVQGVGFRWICAQEAKSRGISGFVRNLPDGRVEAAFEGDDDAVDGMVRWVHGGPEWARVASVEVTDEPPRGDPAFEIR
jgi:acylphosphatase